jgi:hypothetical protein
MKYLACIISSIFALHKTVQDTRIDQLWGQNMTEEVKQLCIDGLECEEVIDFDPIFWDCDTVCDMNQIDMDKYHCWQETDFEQFDCEKVETIPQITGIHLINN